jgi:hypothetical protein
MALEVSATALVSRLLLLLTLAAWAGCAGSRINLDHDVEFDGPDGKRLWKLESDVGNVELEDAYSRDLHEFRPQRGGITFEDSAGRDLEVQGADGGLLLRDRATGVLLYRLRPERDGDYRLEEGEGTVVYQMKRRDYGYKVLGAGERMFKVRRKPGKISIRDRTGATILSTRDSFPPLAASCFCFDTLPIEMRAGLALGVVHWRLDGEERQAPVAPAP